MSSIQEDLWPIVPQLQSVSISLLPPQIVAQSMFTSFSISFMPVSSGATGIRVTCDGMDFSQGCTSQISGELATCTGQLGSASLALLDVLTLEPMPITAAGETQEVRVRRVVNPGISGPTTWSVTTFNVLASGVEVIADQTSGLTGHTVLGYMEMQTVEEWCQPEFLLDPAIPKAQTSRCIAPAPWSGSSGSRVTLTFLGPAGVVRSGQQLVIQPPAAFRFARGEGRDAPFLPHTGFPEVTGQQLSDSERSTYTIVPGGIGEGLPVWDGTHGAEALVVNLAADLEPPFSVQVSVDNPAQTPQRSWNTWGCMLRSGDGTPLYTNDADWQGFPLYGTLSAEHTMIESLVTSFPSELNVVRLHISLASSLEGNPLALRVVAPDEFVFQADCLQESPDFLPQPGMIETATGSVLVTPWVTGCHVSATSRHIATLTVAYPLLQGTRYAVNLDVQNAAYYNASSSWKLYTFHNNDLINFVHYTSVPTFPLLFLEASVFPEAKRYDTSSLLHISFRSLRDLGPFGQVLITAPEGYSLFCRLRPFFNRGNLPSGVECSGGNNFARIQLSGGDFLEREAPYRFAIRVTSPTFDNYVRLHSSSTPPDWGVQLQTRDRDLVHKSVQVPGYLPTERSVTRFAVAANLHRAGAKAFVRVQFKLETELAGWRANTLTLDAPSGFAFDCEVNHTRDSYVVPSQVILPANLERYQELAGALKQPPTEGVEVYRNPGTAEDGRLIVDCSRRARLSMALDAVGAPWTLGRYAFEVAVVNAFSTAGSNVWLLQSHSEGALIEEGITGGYDVSNYTPASSSLGNIFPPVSQATVICPYIALIVLSGVMLAA